VKPVIFHTEAEAELRAAVAHYEERRRGLGGEFQAEVEAAIASIRQTPAAFPLHGEPGTRKHVLRRFPYTIFTWNWRRAFGSPP
jgi:toxin ParE1/3/4